MSRFSEKRLAGDLAKAVEQYMPARRRRAAVVSSSTFFLGLIGNFWFSRVEIAVLLWLLTLVALADLVLSFGKLAQVTGIWRLGLDLLFAMIGLTVSGPVLYEQYRIQYAALLNGTMKAPSPPANYQTIKPVIHLGEATGGFVWGGPNGGSLFKIATDKLTIERDNHGNIQFSTVIRDKTGNLVVEVKKNRWEVSNSKQACWDKNYTDDALEVKDGRGRVVLQVQLLPNGVRLQGEWHDEHGQLMATFTDDRFTEDDGIAPLFKYPSSDYWGEKITPP
jgi:hypothetical protein